MKRVLVVMLLIIIATGVCWSQEENQRLPLLTLNLLLKDAIAFPGIGLELLLGNIGLGGTVSFFFIGDASGDSFSIIEPGLYLHLYLGDPAACLYLFGDLSFATLQIITDDVSVNTGDYNSGIFNINLGGGFNAYFGRKSNIHFSIELGARYQTIIIDGQEALVNEDEGLLPIIPHIQMQFGMGIL